MKLSTKIKFSREKAGMTQSELAQKLNITPQAISQYERGVKVPKFETRKRIADALNISVCEFLDADSRRNYIEEFGTEEERGQLKLEDELNSIFSRTRNETKQDQKLTKEELSDTEKEVKEMNREIEQIKKDLERLNKKGRTEALKRVRELTELSKYKKE